MTTNPVISFSDFPEDLQLSVLSFLTPSEISTFASTSKKFDNLCNNKSDTKLWHAMCDRKWGSKTQIKKWGNGKISYKLLYNTLIQYENLIGFWRKSGRVRTSVEPEHDSPSLVLFEWGPCFVTGSRISPEKLGGYGVVKSPFLWMSVASDGEIVNFVDSDGRIELPEDFRVSELGFSENDLVPVNVSLMGGNHVVIEENLSFVSVNSMNSPEQKTKKKNGFEMSSSPKESGDRFMSEIYQYFANRTSPGTERRRNRKRVKERQGRKKWDSEHFVKIVNCSPTPSRPLQGLWKGICEDMNLDFFLVTYDDIGGIVCRRVGDSCKPFSSYFPVFWTSHTAFIESPLSPEEEYIYESRIRLQPLLRGNEGVLRLLYINSSYDLVLPELAGTVDPQHVEGRIWQYGNGTFGFGFLRDNFIIDLKGIAQDGCLHDIVELSKCPVEILLSDDYCEGFPLFSEASVSNDPTCNC